LARRMEKARRMFCDLVADDMAAYGLYQETTKQPDGPEKDEAVQVAVSAAISVPREMTKLALALLEDLREFAGKCNPWLISDLVASAALAVAAVRLSDYNVRINVPSVSEKAAAGELRKTSAADLAKAIELRETIEQAASEHLP
ncbi:MAG: cyclodeaminase/cyclohydrolase family protein, partial [Phycisphaerae bacterium]|nr:cyclodeaminase/cyclohydrolase family protein [Phycisphaerae bacterium]